MSMKRFARVLIYLVINQIWGQVKYCTLYLKKEYQVEDNENIQISSNITNVNEGNPSLAPMHTLVQEGS